MNGVLTSRFKFDAIGTSWEIDTPAPIGAAIRQRVLNLVGRFNSTYSRFREDSRIRVVLVTSLVLPELFWHPG